MEGNTSIDNVTLVVGEGLGTINGHVTDAETGGPIRALVIAVQKPQKVVKLTNSEGYYEMTDLPVGTWWVLCFKKNYQFAIKRATLLPGDTITLNFSLTPKAGAEVPPEYKEFIKAAPALPSRHKLTITWAAMKKR